MDEVSVHGGFELHKNFTLPNSTKHHKISQKHTFILCGYPGRILSRSRIPSGYINWQHLFVFVRTFLNTDNAEDIKGIFKQ